VGITDGPDDAITQSKFDVPLPSISLYYGSHVKIGQLLSGTPGEADSQVLQVIDIDVSHSVLIHYCQSIVPQHQFV
jgi:hypothetical protein